MRMRIYPIMAFIAIIICLCLIETVQSQDIYYYGLGKQPLIICDSLVSIKFDEDLPSGYSDDFAQYIDALNESIPPIPQYNGFDLFRVNIGYSVAELLELLNNRTDIIFAYPAYIDSVNELLSICDNFLIQYRDTVSQAQIDSIEAFYNVELIRGPDEYSGLRVVKVTEESPGTSLDVANHFYESGLVYYSHPDFVCAHKFEFTPNDPLFQYQYHLDNDGQTGGTPGIDIDMKNVWMMSMGEYYICALIDDGCIQYHEDVDRDCVWWSEGYDFVGANIKWPTPDDDPSPGNLSYHGVACQGIISSKLDNMTGVSSIAPKCIIVPIKAGDDNGYLGGVSTMYDAISYAINVPAYLISCSWGWLPNKYYPSIDSILQYGYDNGRVFVFASGNVGEYFDYGESVCFPANLSSTLAVGAIDKTGAHCDYSGSGEELDVVAPSGETYTLDQSGDLGINPNYIDCPNTSTDYNCGFGGTSASAPQIAGIIALIKARRMLYGLDIVRKVIDSSAVDGIGDTLDTPGF